MSVEKLNAAEDPRRTLTAMQRDLTAINDAIGGLSALAMLADGYQDDTIDIRQIVRLLDPVVSNLRDAAENLEMNLRRTRGGTVGDRPLPGENDLYLCRLSEEYREICEANTGIVSDDESALMDKMLATPADSIVGVGAKLAAVSSTRNPEPSTPCDKLEHRALVEIERLAGFGEQQQAAE